MFPAQRKSGMKRRNPGSECAYRRIRTRVSTGGRRNWPDLLTALRAVAITLLMGLSALPLPAAAKADPAKVIHVAIPAAEAGFDPVRIADQYSAMVIEAIYERLLTYDYLARPAKLVPMVAEALPEILKKLKAGGYKVVAMRAKAPVQTIAQYDEDIVKDLKLPTVSSRPVSSVVQTISE